MGKRTPRPAPNCLPSVVGAELFRPQTGFSDFRYRSKSVLRNFGRMVLTTVRKETSLRSSSTTERACYHTIYNPTKKKCLQHLLTKTVPLLLQPQWIYTCAAVRVNPTRAPPLSRSWISALSRSLALLFPRRKRLAESIGDALTTLVGRIDFGEIEF